MDRDAGLAKPFQLVEDTVRRIGSTEIALRERRRRWRAKAVGVAEHCEHHRTGRSEQLVLRGDKLEDRQRTPGAELRRLLDRAVTAEHGPPPQASLEEVHVRSGEAPIRGTEERKQVATRAVAPRETQQREERLPERSCSEPRAPLDRERHAQRAESSFDRCAGTLERGADDSDVLGSGSVSDEIEDGLGDELERRTATGSLEEANRAIERRRRGTVVEEVALEMGEPGREIRFRAGRELDDVALRERAEVVRRP